MKSSEHFRYNLSVAIKQPDNTHQIDEPQPMENMENHVDVMTSAELPDSWWMPALEGFPQHRPSPPIANEIPTPDRFPAHRPSPPMAHELPEAETPQNDNGVFGQMEGAPESTHNSQENQAQAPTEAGSPSPWWWNQAARPMVRPTGNNFNEYYPGVAHVTRDDGTIEKFICTRDHFYYVPHPSDCKKYFNCQSGQITEYQCGGTNFWSYNSFQCDRFESALCYENREQVEVTDKVEANKLVGNEVNDYQVEEMPNWSLGFWHTLNEGNEEAVPIGSKPTEKSAEVSGEVDHEMNALPECPDGVQTFYPFVGDCRRYYICIRGMPILTACPNSMIWDIEQSQCTEGDASRCPLRRSA